MHHADLSADMHGNEQVYIMSMISDAEDAGNAASSRPQELQDAIDFCHDKVTWPCHLSARLVPVIPFVTNAYLTGWHTI